MNIISTLSYSTKNRIISPTRCDILNLILNNLILNEHNSINSFEERLSKRILKYLFQVAKEFPSSQSEQELITLLRGYGVWFQRNIQHVFPLNEVENLLQELKNIIEVDLTFNKDLEHELKPLITYGFERFKQIKSLRDPNFFDTPLFHTWVKKVIDKVPTPNEALGEQIKVRSFSFQLLSALEDLKDQTLPSCWSFMQANSQKKVIDEVIKPLNLVLSCLSKYSHLDTYISLSDLALFVIHARDYAASRLSRSNFEKLNTILVVTEDLIALQNKLVHIPIFPKTIQQSAKDRFRFLVNSGAIRLLGHLTAEENAIAKQRGFSDHVLIPKQEHLVNRFAYSDTINSLSKEYREIARWLFNQIRVVSFKKLCISLKASCDQLPLLDKPAIIGLRNKSQQWLADIGYRLLPKENRPARCLTVTFDTDGNQLVNGLNELIDHHDILIFDDGAYSGSQIEFFISKLCAVLENKQRQLEGSFKFESTRNIYFLLGFANKKTMQDRLKDIDLTRFNVNLQILCNDWIPSLEEKASADQLCAEQIERIKKIIGPYLTMDSILTSTSWKVPDAVSLSEFFSQGMVPLEIVRKPMNPESFSHFLPCHLHIEDIHLSGPYAAIPPFYKNLG